MLELDAFQLTRPMRGVTEVEANDWQNYGISTHTPHAGRDHALAMVSDV